MKRFYKVGFDRLSREEYEFLLEKRALARKKGNFQLDKRLKAVILVGYQRVKQREAAILRCETHPYNLSRWLALYRKGGYDELSNFKYKGRNPRLSSEQMAELDAIVESDPIEHGYENGGWHAAMVMEVIVKKFGVKFSASMVQKILRKLKFSYKLAKKNSLEQTQKNNRSGWIKPFRQ